VFIDHPVHGSFLGGMTHLPRGRHQFVEMVDQVITDIGNGFPYDADLSGTTVPLTVAGDRLLVNGNPYRGSGIPDGTGTVPWDGHVELAATDVFMYGDFRQPR
jgi:hypothetical protein